MTVNALSLHCGLMRVFGPERTDRIGQHALDARKHRGIGIIRLDICGPNYRRDINRPPSSSDSSSYGAEWRSSEPCWASIARPIHVRKRPIYRCEIHYDIREHRAMNLDLRVCSRARLARDSRFDGKFFIGVLSPRIYCRPVCRARTSQEKNMRYFLTAAAAAEAGFRPCLRCRPECSPGTPAWAGTQNTVSRALRLINVVEQPVRISCGTPLAVTERRPSYKRATFMQAPLALIGSLWAFIAW